MSESVKRGGVVPASERRAQLTVLAFVEHGMVPADVESDVARLLDDDRPSDALQLLLEHR